MNSFIHFWNSIMGLAVFCGIITAFVLSYVLLLPKDKISMFLGSFFSKNILYIGFLISLAAMVSSLVYSEIIGFPPCMFCWWARVMFYPQVFMFGYAIIKKDRNVLPYSLVLTTLGILITIYHSTIQIVGESVVPCSVSGVSCLTRDVFMFGFITIPFMGVVGFGVLLLSLITAKKNK